MNCKMQHKRWMNKIMELLAKNDDKIDWSSLSSNPYAIFILEENQDKLNWEKLSLNTEAMSILEENQDKINWPRLSINPNAISILQKNQDKIDWNWLSSNLNAMSILQKNQNKIDWQRLSVNNGIWEINYVFLKERMDILREDLIKTVFHPKKFCYFLTVYNYDIFDFELD